MSESAEETGSTTSTRLGWNPPRNPLPPHRLAKIANALGVSTPLPALPPSGNSALSPTYSATTPSLTTEYHRRSPTPGTGSTQGHSPNLSYTSKFLLHVVPPLHLLHDEDAPEILDSTPPPNASGYHVHFRRGILLPFHSTLQSQLGTIAKEYALPNTTGMVLYLVSSSPSPSTSHAENERSVPEAPGPRLTEDIWKHLWGRVNRIERDEPSQSPTPYLLATSLGRRSSPFLPRDVSVPVPPPPLTPQVYSSRLVELSHPRPLAYPVAPPSPSSISEIRSFTKSAPPSSTSNSEIITPNTSPTSHPDDNQASIQAEALDLPGLHLSSFIPVLAKVEFDIDRRKAGWYEPWLRSRRSNHAKRAESRLGKKTTTSTEDRKDEETERKPPLDLTLVGRVQADVPGFLVASVKSSEPESGMSFNQEQICADPQEHSQTPAETPEIVQVAANHEDNTGYEQLPDDTDIEQETDPGEDVTGNPLPNGSKDPLADVFGTDSDAWANMAADSQARERLSKPHIDELTLSEATMSPLFEELSDEDEDGHPNDEEEVREIMQKMTRHQSNSMPDTTVSIAERRSSKWLSGSKKPVPPPLVLDTLLTKGTLERNTLLTETDDNSKINNKPLAENGNGLPPEDPEAAGSREPGMEKRDGGVFDDFDLGLGSLGEDEVDNQFRFKNKLDEIEKALALFAPHRLGPNRQSDGSTHDRTVSSPFSPVQPIGLNTHNPRSKSTDLLQETRPPTNREDQSVNSSTVSAEYPDAQKPPSTSSSQAPLPPLPHFAVNGVATPTQHLMLNSPPTTTLTRISVPQHKLQEQGNNSGDYGGHLNASPPIIPLSPDPFGRFPSTIPSASTVEPSLPRRESPKTDPVRPHQRETSRTSVASSIGANSRFSADSSTAEETISLRSSKGVSLVSVKSFKKLWRRSSKPSLEASPNSAPPTPPPPPPPTPASSSFPSMAVPKKPILMQPARIPGGTSVREQLAALIPPPPPRSSRSNAPPSPVPTRRKDTLSEKLHPEQDSPRPLYSASPVNSTYTSNQHPPSPALSTPSEPSARASTISLTEKDKTVARKSILKWRNSNSSQKSISLFASEKQAGQRRPSTSSLGTATLTGDSPLLPPSPALPPPSPALPEQYANRSPRLAGNGKHVSPDPFSPPHKILPVPPSPSAPSSPRPPIPNQSPNSSTTLLSEGSTRPYSASLSSMRSRESGDSRPSFDMSQFDIVSPKIRSSKTLPTLPETRPPGSF